MKLTICGSIAFYDEMEQVQKQLQALGHEVKIPPMQFADEQGNMISTKEFYKQRKSEGDIPSWVWQRKAEAIRWHFEKVAWGDAIVVLNYLKNEIPNYIGANTLLEMGLAFYLHKKIFLLNDIPEMSYKEEIFGMLPQVIHGDFLQIQ